MMSALSMGLPPLLYNLLKTPLILASSTYNSKTSLVTPILHNKHIKMQLFTVSKNYVESIQSQVKFTANFKDVFSRSCAMKLTLTCLPMKEQLFDTMIVTSTKIEWL